MNRLPYLKGSAPINEMGFTLPFFRGRQFVHAKSGGVKIRGIFGV
jgi:hypothetical protein